MVILKQGATPSIQKAIKETPAISRANSANYQFFAAYEETALLGFLGWWVVSGASCRYAFIIIRSYQRGVGTALVNHLLTRIHNVDWFIQITDPTNTASIKLGQRFGFTKEAYKRFSKLEPDLQLPGYIAAKRV